MKSNQPRTKYNDSELLDMIKLDHPNLKRLEAHQVLITLRLRGLLK